MSTRFYAGRSPPTFRSSTDQVRAGCESDHREGARHRGTADVTRPRRRGDRMKTRRAFVRLLGGAAAAWPLGARAQQRSLLTIGFLDIRSPDAMADRLRGFRQGLAATGYVEGDNVTIVYRWAENKIDQVPELVADLVRRQVAVMLVSGSTSAA